jgi:hypothetical protein
MNLFPKTQKIGVFRGYREGGLEFHADLAIPYKQHLQNRQRQVNSMDPLFWEASSLILDA